MSSASQNNSLARQAKKSLGQHFLVNSSVCQRIVALLDVQEGDKIIEIGPGPGALSDILLKLPFGRLDFIEKDARWADRLSGEARENAQVYNMDALAFPWGELEGEWKIIGNLPYNVASPLIWDIVSQTPRLIRAVFMIQLEVAERLSASPGSRDYGALSVWVQSFMKVRKEFKVSPGSFSPPPKVDSGVVLLLPRDRENLPGHPARLSRLLKICFQNRRKQLGTIFKMNGLSHMADILSKLGIDPSLRPESLSPFDFDALSGYLRDD